MSEHPRISEATGIRTHADEAEAVWPLNVVLGILGAAILGVAFSFLDTQDTRLLYNPWTYAIATPLVLIGLSTLLSMVVSRLIEKSMQMAFLLSVLVHLVLLVCAMNVVVFSRMWPDVLDSLAQHREQLKRETLQAKQYHRISSMSQTGRRPDYLKPAQTEHQPTEIENVQAPALVLAHSQRANLVSPSPQLEITHTPHLMERDKPASTLPSSIPQSASLSRSHVIRQRPPTREPIPDSQVLDAPQPRQLNPSTASLKRRRDSQPAFVEPPELSATARVDVLPRLELPSSESHLAAATLLARASKSPTFEALDRQSWDTAPPNRRVPQSSLPAEALDSSHRFAEVSPGEAASGRRRSDSRLAMPPIPDYQPPAVLPIETLSPLATSLPLRESPAQSPIPPASDTAFALARNIAGGRMGVAAPSSMPIRGVEDVGATKPQDLPDQRVAKSDITKRRTGDARAASQLPNVGGPQNPTWDGSASLAQGMTGRSPSQLAENAGDGGAASRDNAGLTGSGRTIDRSALGGTGVVGPVISAIDSQLAQNDQLDAASRAEAELSAAAAAITRTRAAAEDSQSLRIYDLLARSLDRASPSIAPSEMKRVEASAASRAATEKQASPNDLFERNVAMVVAGGTPGQPKIELPQAEMLSSTSGGAQLDGNTQASEVSRSLVEDRSSNTAAPATLLEIDQQLGAGGIAAELGQDGTLLNRRDAPLSDWSPPQLESQRFARQDVGGRLAGGQEVALPKPAFQQRLDRLQDRKPQAESMLEPQTELAIERGLAFLAKHQRSDGSWRLQDLDPQVLLRSDTAATGLALLSFQGAGYTHNQFKYRSTVDKAVQFLVKNQRSDGDLYVPQDPASDQNAWLYSHAIATLAMCEAVGMTQDEELRPAAQHAIDFMVASQDPLRGGWRYRPGVGSDTSVTGWFMMAFKSGQLAGLDVPPKAFGLIEKFLAESQAYEPYLYRYNPFASDTPQQRHGLQPTSVMTSVGLLMRLYLGWQRERPEMMAGADYLLEHLPEHGSATVSRRDTYYWYYATQVMFHMRGERWQQWHDRLYPLLINSQIIEGEMEGSWDPNYPTPDLWARYGGRHYVTTMNLLSLEVSYRHLPLYEATAK